MRGPVDGWGDSLGDEPDDTTAQPESLSCAEAASLGLWGDSEDDDAEVANPYLDEALEHARDAHWTDDEGIGDEPTAGEVEPERPDDEVEAAITVTERDEGPNLTTEEVREFFTDTAKNILIDLAQTLADAHAVGGVVRLIRYGIEAVELLQTADGQRGVGVDIPLLTGPGVELDLSMHLGDEEGPPVTFCCALGRNSSVGLPPIDGAEIGPGDKLNEACAEAERTVSASPNAAPVEPVEITGPESKIPRDQPRKMSDALEKHTKRKKLPEKLRHLYGEDADLVVWYSTATEGIALIYLNGDADPSWRMAILQKSPGQIRFHVS
jgi:hypothetical protein